MIDSLMENGFWFHIFRFLIGSSALLLTVWILELTRVIKNFEVRAFCWKAALLGSLLLLLPLSLPQAPTLYIDIPNNWESHSAAEILQPSFLLEDTESISSVGAPQQTTDTFMGNSAGGTDELLTNSATQILPPKLISDSSKGLVQERISKVFSSLSAIPMSSWMIVIWVFGSSLALTRLYLGNRRGIQSLGKRRPVDDSDPIRQTFYKLCKEVGLTKRPRLTRSTKTCSPVTLPGLEVCLPDWVNHSLPESELRSLLAHELGHIRHHDLKLLLGLQLLTCLFFFQPLFVLARNRLIDLSEFQADQVALTHSENRNAITTALVNCADRMISEKPFKWGFAMIGNASRLKLRILQLQNPGKLNAGRFSKAGRTIVLTTVFSIVLLSPTIQNETRADVAVLHSSVDLPKTLESEAGIRGTPLVATELVNNLESELDLTGQAPEAKQPEPTDHGDEQRLVPLQDNLQSFQQNSVDQEEELEARRQQLLEQQQRLEEQRQHQLRELQEQQQQLQDQYQQRQEQLQEQQQRLQEQHQQQQRQLQEQEQQLLEQHQQKQRQLQEEQQRLQGLDQQLSLSEEYQGKTYLLLNYSSSGPIRIRDLVLTESGSQVEIRIRNIQSLERGDENYSLTEVEPGSYYVTSYYPVPNLRFRLQRTEVDLTIRGLGDDTIVQPEPGPTVSDLLGPIQIVENSINYIGDIRINTGFSLLSTLSGIQELEFSPSASTLQSAARDNPELFRSKDVVASIATHEPVAIDNDLLGVRE